MTARGDTSEELKVRWVIGEEARESVRGITTELPVGVGLDNDIRPRRYFLPSSVSVSGGFSRRRGPLKPLAYLFLVRVVGGGSDGSSLAWLQVWMANAFESKLHQVLFFWGGCQ